MDLRSKTVLITGGGTGIGRAVAIAAAREGANVVVNYSRSKAEAEKTLAEVERCGTQGFMVQTDVSDNNQVVRMREAALERFGRIDCLVNNAGPEDIAQVTIALIRSADFVTGQTIVVDGGWSL